MNHNNNSGREFPAPNYRNDCEKANEIRETARRFLSGEIPFEEYVEILRRNGAYPEKEGADIRRT